MEEAKRKNEDYVPYRYSNGDCFAVFGVIGTVEQHNGGTVDRDAYNGFYKTNPKLSFVMTIALFSLAGIPPFAGFFSKFFVFASAFQCRPLAGSIPGVGKYNHFAILLPARCKGQEGTLRIPYVLFPGQAAIRSATSFCIMPVQQGIRSL